MTTAALRERATRYPVVVCRLADADGGGWWASVPDLPGTFGDGTTESGALRDARAAIAATLEALDHWGRIAPPPSAVRPLPRPRGARSPVRPRAIA